MSNIVIIGSGPAGLSAAVYAQRAELDTGGIERNMPWTAPSSSRITTALPSPSRGQSWSAGAWRVPGL